MTLLHRVWNEIGLLLASKDQIDPPFEYDIEKRRSILEGIMDNIETVLNK